MCSGGKRCQLLSVPTPLSFAVAPLTPHVLPPLPHTAAAPSPPQTLEFVMQPAEEGGAPGGTLWMVQQMCNHGTLIEAGE